MPSSTSRTLIATENISKNFSLKNSNVQALKNISLQVHQGETLGIVGESGSGKSTLARVIMGLLAPDSGTILYEDIDLLNPSKSQRTYIAQNMQMVFQNPYASLNPRMNVMSILSEPFEIHHTYKSQEARKTRVYELLEEVGLNPIWATKYPHEFSGGQRQRIAIARALALKPKFIVCDEAVSALDVSVQTQIILLLKRIQKEHGLTMIFISHDLSVVRLMSDRVGVMYKGELIEIADSDEIYKCPKTAYTQELLNAVLPIDPSVARKKIEAAA